MMTKKILEMSIDEIKIALSSGSITVCVVGIGRIGLPTALSFANSGLITIGLDINSKLVETVNSGIYPLNDEPEYDVIFDKVINEKTFFATSKIEESVPNSDVILLSLPTPMNEHNIPDYSALRIVAKQLNQYLSPGSIVIVESTIEPGFVENELISLIEGNRERLRSEENFKIGVCPETANPGEIMKDFQKLPRLVGGIDKISENIIFEIYNYVFPVELIRLPNCKTANAVKLTTNVFRDINIAFINELSLLFEKLDIDTMKVLDAAKAKYNFQVHYPGAGVGGPCLPVNSYQLLNSASKFDSNMLKIVKASREINENMPNRVIDLLIDGLGIVNKNINTSQILLLGISYKPNVKDIQLTPAESIINKLHTSGAKVKIYDPYFVNSTVFNIETESDFISILPDVDAVIIVTAHNEFLDLDPTLFASKMKTPIVIDTRAVLDIDDSKKAGIIYRGIGRGKFN